jgi:hypothetical protein
MRRLVLFSSLTAGLLVAMAVNAVAAGETWTPASADFGQVAVGAKSAPKSFTLTAGTSSYPADPAVFDNSDEFLVDRGTCGGDLDPGDSCTASVVFAPSSTGAKTGTLRGGATFATPAAPLTGTGVANGGTNSPGTKPKKKCKKKGKKSAVAAKKKCKKNKK